MLSYGCVTMLTQHGKCVTSLRGSAVQSGAVILEAASGACHRRGHMVIAADTLQSLVVDQYRWLPRDGGHTLEQPISSRQCLLGNPGGVQQPDTATLSFVGCLQIQAVWFPVQGLFRGGYVPCHVVGQTWFEPGRARQSARMPVFESLS